MRPWGERRRRTSLPASPGPALSASERVRVGTSGPSSWSAQNWLQRRGQNTNSAGHCPLTMATAVLFGGEKIYQIPCDIGAISFGKHHPTGYVRE